MTIARIPHRHVGNAGQAALPTFAHGQHMTALPAIGKVSLFLRQHHELAESLVAVKRLTF